MPPASGSSPARYVLPVSPPPDVDVEGWFRTFEEIERRQPERLALIHFGVAESPSEHLALVRAELERWASREDLDQEAWIAAAREPLVAAVGEDEAGHWERAAPLWQSYVGMRRYWDKRAQRRLGPLQHRLFRLLFAGRAVSFLGNAMANTALAFAVLDVTGSKRDLGFVLAARSIPQIVFILAGGILADRLPRNVVMVGSNLASMATQGVARRAAPHRQRRALDARRDRRPERIRLRVLLPRLRRDRPADGAART